MSKKIAELGSRLADLVARSARIVAGSQLVSSMEIEGSKGDIIPYIERGIAHGMAAEIHSVNAIEFHRRPATAKNAFVFHDSVDILGELVVMKRSEYREIQKLIREIHLAGTPVVEMAKRAPDIGHMMED